MNSIATDEEGMSDTALVSLVSKAELDQAIATAHQWPRSLTKFRRDALEMATMDEQTANECIYALPRKDQGETKMITGPSARLAEIIISAWGNVRAGARVIDEGREFVTAQGVFHDLEKNVGITYEVKRRITGRNGNRYSADMIAVTANAACSIALRNAVFKGVPKALWASVESEVRRVIAGDSKTLGARREKVMGALNKMGVPNERVFALLDVAGMADIGLDEIVMLQGLGNAIKEGEMSIEEAFAPREREAVPSKDKAPAVSRTESAKAALKPETPPAAVETPAKQAEKPAERPKPTPKVEQPAPTAQRSVEDEWDMLPKTPPEARRKPVSDAQAAGPASPSAPAEKSPESPSAPVGPPFETDDQAADYLAGSKTKAQLRLRWDEVLEDMDARNHWAPDLQDTYTALIAKLS